MKKKQHYVPQCYLEQFCGDKLHINVFDKDTKKIFGCNILDVAREICFYDFPEFNEEEFKNLNPDYTKAMIDEVKKAYKDFGEGQALENSLSDIESKFSEVLKEIIKKFSSIDKYSLHKNGKLFNDQEKKIIANLIALQITRTKAYRVFIKKMIYLQIRNQLNEIPEKDFVPEIFEKNMEKQAAIVQGACMSMPEYIGMIMKDLINRYWVVGINETYEELYTSDNPVVYKFLNNKYDAYNLFNGFLGTDLISYPLNNRIVIMMYKKEHQEKCIRLNKGYIKSLNILQVKCSTRQIYSINNNFNVAKKVLKNTGIKYESKSMNLFMVREHKSK